MPGLVIIWGQIGCGDDCDKLVPTKVIGLNGNKVKMISCGCYHSMALTESGCVYIWGDNRCGQLGVESIENSNKANQLELKDIVIVKITCSAYNSLLLTNQKDIYAFGSNFFGQMIGSNQIKPEKLNHEKKFIDIASHWSAKISIARSLDNLYYVWSYCKEENILSSIESERKSFNEILVHFDGNSAAISEKFIEFDHLFLSNGYYER